MSTARPILAATHREVTGKAVAHLRRDGQLPGVLFGHGVDSTSVTVDTREFEQLRRHAGANMLIDLSIDGKKPRPVLVHGVQVHPVTRRPLHVDLFQVRMTEELTVDVPLVPTGTAEAVEMHGGTLLMLLDTLKVRALPDHLPQSILVPLEPLVGFDSVVKVADLAIPTDVTLVTDLEETVAKVAPPRIEAVPLEEGLEAAEGEEGVEGGEAAEGEEGESAAGGAASEG